MRVRKRDLIRAWARTFAVQGSWNYETMVGAGLGFAMLPLLRRMYAENPAELAEAVARHSGPFNSHPYLCGVAVGALARLEQEGASRETLRRFRVALRSPLGTLGDRLVWAQWRPFCLLCGLLAHLAGLGPWLAVAGALALYNAGHLGLRTWALHVGWTSGREVGSTVRRSWLGPIARRLEPVNLFLTGVASMWLAATLLESGGRSYVWWAIAFVPAALGGFRWPSRGGRLAALLLLLAPLTWALIR
ncbi:MAG: PTS system mannose/fructose/sorbose family transporter subunit IID [Gemmatimonadota bacterium]